MEMNMGNHASGYEGGANDFETHPDRKGGVLFGVAIDEPLCKPQEEQHVTLLGCAF